MTNPKNNFTNLVAMFWEQVGQYGNRCALLFKNKLTDSYQSYSWYEWAGYVKRTALALYQMGVRSGDRVALLSENRPEWTFADLGILSLRAITVPIYPTLPAHELYYIIKHAGIKTIFVSSEEQLMKLRSQSTYFGELKNIIVFDSYYNQSQQIFPYSVFLKSDSFTELNNQGLYEKQMHEIAPDDRATIIYTSGTTGKPKGVVLTHRNFIENCTGCQKYVPVDHRDVVLSFLPLSHVFERMAGYYYMILNGATIAYAESMQTVPEDMLMVRPTVVASVPRFYEKFYIRVQETVQNASGLRKILLPFAMKLGSDIMRRKLAHQKISVRMALMSFMTQMFILRQLKKRLGGRIRFFISGGAPMPKHLLEFFYSLGVLILEGYGLTETSPVIAVNSYDDFKFGTVGKSLPNVEVKIMTDGEIVTRGPCVMKEYYQDAEATRDAVRNGWFYTGDLGTLEQGGFLSITDRKKDIIVTSSGKNIAPQNIENMILQEKLFSQVVVVGDKRNYLVALIVPDRSHIQEYAGKVGLADREYPRLLQEPDICNYVQQKLAEQTKQLASYEQIKYFALLDRELTMAEGEITPTFKVKRRYVMERFKDVIESLYQKGQTYQKIKATV
ncbi:MAG: long-chain fatty acid--CoA ligase [Candidatus Omnitrophica bacterium]|nr:long-chain fatty acid--CoA ligase [Candidatus Omnitrophota bacterium]